MTKQESLCKPGCITEQQLSEVSLKFSIVSRIPNDKFILDDSTLQGGLKEQDTWYTVRGKVVDLPQDYYSVAGIRIYQGNWDIMFSKKELDQEWEFKQRGWN